MATSIFLDWQNLSNLYQYATNNSMYMQMLASWAKYLGPPEVNLVQAAIGGAKIKDIYGRNTGVSLLGLKI